SDATGAGASWPFTTTDTNFNVAVQSTTTPEWFKTPVSGIFSLMASSTAWFDYASTTEISAATASSTNLIVSGVRSALHLAGADGTVSAYGGTTCTNQFVRSLNGAGAATCNSVSLTADVSG